MCSTRGVWWQPRCANYVEQGGGTVHVNSILITLCTIHIENIVHIVYQIVETSVGIYLCETHVQHIIKENCSHFINSFFYHSAQQKIVNYCNNRLKYTLDNHKGYCV